MRNTYHLVDNDMKPIEPRSKGGQVDTLKRVSSETNAGQMDLISASQRKGAGGEVSSEADS